MGRLILMMNVTLDGCCDHTQVIADEELHRYTEELMDGADGLLLGREIYRLMESAWPAVADSGDGPTYLVDFARKMDRIPKYVFSRTLDRVTWQNAILMNGPVEKEVPRLLSEGKTLVVNGGPGLGSALARLGLVDEYRFLMQPIVAGRGPRLLEGAHDRLNLKLTDSKPFGSGVVALRYATLPFVN